MSFAICRISKYSSSHDIAGLQIHDRRERRHSNSNPDIDFSKSKDNYSLCSAADGMSFNEFIGKQIAERYTGKKAIRKDAVRMVQVLFTSDSNFFGRISEEQQRRFFEDCCKWAAERWGAENIISADVHLDEVTPHMHLNFVPLTADGRLSAKDCVGNGSRALQSLQDDFYKTVGKPHGLDRGLRTDLVNGERARKHQTVAGYKESTDYYEQKKEKLIAEVSRLQEQVNDYNEILKAEPMENISGIAVPSAARLLIGKENKDKLLYSPETVTALQETAKALAVSEAQLAKDKAEYDEKETRRAELYGEEKEIGIWQKNAESYKAEADEAERKREAAEKAKRQAEKEAAAIREEADRYAAEKQEFYAERFPYVRSLMDEKAELQEDLLTLESTKNELIECLDSRNREISGKYYKLKKEKDEEISSLKKELSELAPIKEDNRRLSEQVRTLENAVKEKDGIISRIKAKIEELTNENNVILDLYNTVCEIGKYICRKLGFDFDKILDKRIHGYRLSYLIDEGHGRGER